MGKRDITIVRKFEGNVVTFDAGAAGKISADIGALSETMRARLVVHGLFAKMGDAMALPMGSSVAMKFTAADEVWKNLLAGEWDAKRTSLTPEQRAEKLRVEVGEAWISLKDGRTMTEYVEFVRATAERNSKALKQTISTEMVVAGLAKRPDIAGAIAARRAPTGISLEFDDA